MERWDFASLISHLNQLGSMQASRQINKALYVQASKGCTYQQPTQITNKKSESDDQYNRDKKEQRY
jgi:hypothetical protein